MRVFRHISPLILTLAVAAFSQTTNLPQENAQKWMVGPVPGNDASNLASGPVLVHAVPAEYPHEAEVRRLYGHCTVRFQVDTKGVPKDIRVEECSNPLFISATYAAANLYRFKPATDVSGNPVEAGEFFKIHYSVFDGSAPTAKVGYSLHTPPGTTTTDADPSGVYPLTRKLTPPKMTAFAESGLGVAAFGMPEGSSCDVQLVITVEGRTKSPWVSHCDDSVLEKPVVASLLKSRFQPASLNGQAVPVKVFVHLVYQGLVDPHQE
jgi:hypothetical protein